MNVLIALAEPLPPQQSGGSQKVAFEIAARLSALGDTVTVAGRLDPRRVTALPRLAAALLSGRSFAAEHQEGVRVIRFVRETISFSQVLETVRPDVVLLHGMAAMPIAHIISSAGLPLVVYWHDVERNRMGGSPLGLVASYISNSGYTAEFYLQEFGLRSIVIPPIFQSRGLSTSPASAGEVVLFVNPVPEKGLELALEIAARLPHRAFEFLLSWRLDRTALQTLRSRLAPLVNVTLIEHQADMEAVYKRAGALIAPSRWAEAWGRVVTEAQAAGLPVIARGVGGLPEAVALGGIVMSPTASAEEWVTELERLFTDAKFRTRVAADARNRAAALSPETHVRLLRHELNAAAGRE